MADDVERFLGSYPSDVRTLALQLRALVLSCAPKSHEAVRGGWKAITYGTGPGMKETFAAISPQRTWVNLGFTRGAQMEDPKGLLEGSGKGIRHVKVRSPEDARSPALKTLVKQALAMVQK